MRCVIRNAVLHISNEQPLLADLFELPGPTDVALRCTNLRMLDGKRPIFVDDMNSVFFFPYLHIRFVEIPPSAVAGTRPGRGDAGPRGRRRARAAAGRGRRRRAELEIDEDFLRRIREV